MCMYDVINKKAKMRRQKHKNMFESVVLIVKRAKMRALHTNVRGVRAHVADAVRQKHHPGKRLCDDDKADDYCYGVQILEFEPFRTQIQNTN